MEITNITLSFERYSSLCYKGTLRNEKIFDIGDMVFFVYAGINLSFGKIVGVELSDDENPDRIYKIKLHKDFCEYVSADQDNRFEDIVHYTRECDEIFSNIEEAKKSAIKRNKLEFELQNERINNYFKQFEKE